MLQQIQKKGLLAKLAHFSHRWWVKFVVMPLLATLPLAFIQGIYRFDVIKLAIKPHVPEWFFFLYKTYPIITYMLPFLYVYFLMILWGALRAYGDDNCEVDYKGFMAISTALENVVSAKHERFGVFAKRVFAAPNTIERKDAFSEITKPEQQIALLAESLRSVFEYFDKDRGASFRIRVIEVKNGLPESWFYFTPQSDAPTTTMDQLRNPQSSLTCCLRNKRILVIEDLQREAKKGKRAMFVNFSDDPNESGSLICYPIVHGATNDIPYVITVMADINKYFRREETDYYKWIFKHFALRINLEHSLFLIKEGTIDV
jgi:hypothetical protein